MWRLRDEECVMVMGDGDGDGDGGGGGARLSAFGDEIADDLEEQLQALATAGLRWLDLRGVWGRNVLALSDSEVERVKATLARRGLAVACVASPVGKAPVAGDFAEQRAALERALEIAWALGTRYVRIFSWYIPAGEDADTYREVVLDRLGQCARLAEAREVVLLHENEGGLYGDSPERCRDLLDQIDSPALRAVWDPGNFVAAGYDPLDDTWPLLQPWIEYVHVKDVCHEGSSRRIVVTGEGDARWPACIAALHAGGYRGVYALEPHLTVAGPASGFSGPAGFQQAHAAFVALLAAQGVTWE
jgi:3-dehydroshikimate dehydratase